MRRTESPGELSAIVAALCLAQVPAAPASNAPLSRRSQTNAETLQRSLVAPKSDEGGNAPTLGHPGAASSRDTANLSEQAHQQASHSTPTPGKSHRFARPAKGGSFVPSPHHLAIERKSSIELSPAAAKTPLIGGTPFPSPPLSASFPALGDDGTVRTPDTQGAVGPNHLMVTLNSQVRIQDRAGTTLITMSLEGWWSSFGASNVLNPRVLYDPYGQRWIFAAIADKDTPSGLLVAVSQTSDPTANWNRYFVSADPLTVEAPSVGFNTNRIVVQVNSFDNASGFDGSSIYAFNKANLYAGGAGQYTLFAFQNIGDPTSDLGNSQVPAVTLHPTMGTNYLVQNFAWVGDEMKEIWLVGFGGISRVTWGLEGQELK